MKILLVWTRYPEQNWLFQIENPTEEQLGVLKKAMDTFMDAFLVPEEVEKDEATHKIAAAVGDKKREQSEPEWDSIWVDNKVITTVNGPSSELFCCGWGRDETTNPGRVNV